MRWIKAGVAAIAGIWLVVAAIGGALLLRAEDPVDADAGLVAAPAPPTREEAECERKYDAEFAYIPSPVQNAAPGPAEPPGFVRYGSGPAHILVAVGYPVPQIPDTQFETRVLGAPAVLGEIEGGHSVEFTYRDCDLSLLGHGLSRGHLLNFSLSLVPPPDLGADVFRQRYRDGDSCPRAFGYPGLPAGAGCVSGLRGPFLPSLGEDGRFYLYAEVDGDGRPQSWLARIASADGTPLSTIVIEVPPRRHVYPQALDAGDANGDGLPDAFVSLTRGAGTDMIGLFLWADGEIRQARMDTGELLVIPVGASSSRSQGGRCETIDGEARLVLTTVRMEGPEAGWMQRVLAWTGPARLRLDGTIRGEPGADRPPPPGGRGLRCGGRILS